MCGQGNEIIFEITAQEKVKIPKLGKACDIFHLSVEQLRHAGEETLIQVLRLLNLIIDNISYLSQPQLNTAVDSVIFKVKLKPVTKHKLYKLVQTH